MKKTVVVIILAVLLASVAVVNFFGLEIKQYTGETYIGSIEVSDAIFLGDGNESLVPTQNGRYIDYVFDYVPPENYDPAVLGSEEYSKDNIEENRNMVRLDFLLLSEEMQILPFSDGMIDYIYSEDTGVAFYHEGTGSFVFLKPNQRFTITLKSTDGHGASTQVRIMARLRQE